MIKTLVLILVLFIGFFSFSQNSNVLLIIGDDLGIDALNGYELGDIDPYTPHLDSLRENGLNFTNAWSSPVCTPTRAGIMSGKYGSKNGVKTAPGNLDTLHVSIFNALKNINPNFATAAIGKWHVSKPISALHPGLHGVDHYMGILGAGWPAYDDWDKTENGVTANSTEYATIAFTNDAINWIGTQSNPWMLWLAHIAPHTPYHDPPAYMHSQPSLNSAFKKYMAMIESLDYEVGRLLDAMTPVEKANTTIIFIGDNGTPENVLQDYEQDRGKETLYQGGVHVPMFVSGYGVTRMGETEASLVNVIDIYATILELEGNDLPGGIYNSLSFKHLLEGSPGETRKYNMSELDTNNVTITHYGHTIRNDVYKLIENGDGSQELYNVFLDTLEENNLLLSTLSPFEDSIKIDLEQEAFQRQNNWSCRDDIQNGDETGIDCGGSFCPSCNLSVNEKNQIQRIIVYPNPSKGIFTIQTKENIDRIQVYSLQGKTLQDDKGNNSRSQIVYMNSIEAQVAIVKVTTINGIVYQRLLIK